MALISSVGNKSAGNRMFTAFVYLALIVLGTTMVVPFLITLSGSTANDFDYERFRPIPRYIFSTQDRFVKGLVYFFNGYRGWSSQMKCYVPDMPETWTAWNLIGQDISGIDRFAKRYMEDGVRRNEIRAKIASDYSEFAANYPVEDTVVTVINPQAVNFLEDYYGRIADKIKPGLGWRERRKEALRLLGEKWRLPYESFYNANFTSELNAPMDFQGWFPSLSDPKYQDFLRLKEAYRAHIFTPGIREAWLKYLKKNGYQYGDSYEVFPVMQDSPENLRRKWSAFCAENAPASPCVPFALRAAWYQYLRGEEAGKIIGLPAKKLFTVDTYNELSGTSYSSIEQTPFPVPETFAPGIRKLWHRYVESSWPLRLTTIAVKPDMELKYHSFLESQIKYIRIANELLGTKYSSWSEFKLLSSAPKGDSEQLRNKRGLWANFVKQLPMESRSFSSSEISYQRYLLEKYGTLEQVNKAYAWNLKHIEEAFPPFMDAYAVTFVRNEMAFTYNPVMQNYRIIVEYLLLNANAVTVTLLLICMSVLCTLTINPIAAYSMSRFNLKGQSLVILYMLATMAFPAMVSAIPAYLLMRDLNLLNTFFALVLPGAANGMAIFILKGFFDSLPQELFEAATIDGANEAQIFRIVAMPLVKPILAINSLSAFIAAYNGWEWALIVCQDKSKWTIAVWLYQASQWWSTMPWIVSAGFVVASIPTLVVFIFCQKMILRGIVIPAMK